MAEVCHVGYSYWKRFTFRTFSPLISHSVINYVAISLGMLKNVDQRIVQQNGMCVKISIKVFSF